MIKEEKCIICGSGDLTSVSAAIAPFIRIRCEIDEVLPDFRRLYCPACDFSFFNYRLSVEEVSSLYKGYRSKEYNELRTELEPDWISTCRSFADRSNSSHIARVNQLVSILKEWEIFPSMVLDYGGEEDAWLTRGAFPDAKVQNFDISYKSEQLDANVFDLVVAHTCLNTFHIQLSLSKKYRNTSHRAVTFTLKLRLRVETLGQHQLMGIH